jgi:hypothetical protein
VQLRARAAVRRREDGAVVHVMGCEECGGDLNWECKTCQGAGVVEAPDHDCARCNAMRMRVVADGLAGRAA